MAAATRQSLATHPGTGPAAPTLARRQDLPGRHAAAGAWAPEIQFLAAQGVAPGLLLRASEVAAKAGVSSDAALLGEGFPEDTFYRMLARHLGVPYLERPVGLALPSGHGISAGRAGMAPLAVNDRRLAAVLSPRAQALRDLLRLGRSPSPRYGIISPRCLAALVRRHDRAALLHAASRGLRDWDASLSAAGGLTFRQKAAVVAAGALLCLGLGFALPATLSALAGLVSGLFLAAVLLRLAATAASVPPTAAPGERIPDHALPTYTVLVPLQREARIVPQLIRAIEAIDYPRAKLDVKIIVEANDSDTIAALQALSLPAPYEVIVAPVGHPQTKPRALNIGLLYARGDFVVVYDAEDRPEPDQLRAAVAAFRARPSHVACLQAQLTIDHIDESWLTSGIMAQMPQAA